MDKHLKLYKRNPSESVHGGGSAISGGWVSEMYLKSVPSHSLMGDTEVLNYLTDMTASTSGKQRIHVDPRLINQTVQCFVRRSIHTYSYTYTYVWIGAFRC
jgi:hypothetical protein